MSYISDLNEENFDLRHRLFVLTGCPNFGEMSGDIGSCVDCSHNNEELWEKCSVFSQELYSYRKRLSDALSVKEVWEECPYFGEMNFEKEECRHCRCYNHVRFDFCSRIEGNREIDEPVKSRGKVKT